MTHYSIREVDGCEYNDDLEELHRLTFADYAPMVNFSDGYWWLAFAGKEPVAFAGMAAAESIPGAGYIVREGVRADHRGRGLQKRLTRACLRKAKVIGWSPVVTDTHFNPASGNSLIACGFRLFTPEKPWSFPAACYWRHA